MSSDFVILPDDEAGDAFLAASPALLVRYRATNDGGLCFDIAPQNRTTTTHLLAKLAYDTDKFVLEAEPAPGVLLARLDHYYELAEYEFAALLDEQPLVGLMIAAMILAAHELRVLTCDRDNCVSALTGSNATPYTPPTSTLY